MADNKCLQTIQTNFSLYGLVLSRELRTSLAKYLLRIPEDERESWLGRIIELILAQKLDSPHVGAEHIKLAIEECLEPNKLRDTETIFNVISGYNIPRIKYDICKNKFVIDKENLYSEAQCKSLIFKCRFDMVWHKTLRHKQFSSSKFEKLREQEDKVNLIPIEYLLSELKTGKVCIMGLITQLMEDQYYLEDSSGTVKIDLSNTKYEGESIKYLLQDLCYKSFEQSFAIFQYLDFQDTFIMEGCIVIANGVYEDDILHVENISFPPIESSESFRSDFGDTNTFGGLHNISLKMSEKLQVHEQSNQDGMIIFIAELWLDIPNVLQKFRMILEGYTDYPPIAFVLCGHFLSFPANVNSGKALITGFKNLVDIIAQYPNVVESSKFVFVPGSHDLGSPKILPKPPLPKCIVEEVTKMIPSAIFTTNPCRIQYCTKEIVVLREDMLTKMCRNTLRFPKEEDFFKHFAKAIISQSHLTPVPLQVVPVYWKYDYALQIFPTPDLIVIADNFETYTTNYSDCYVINPGMFSKNNFSFQAYVPAMNQIQDCQLPSDTNVA